MAAPPILDQQQLMQLGMITGDLESDLFTAGAADRHGSASSPSSSGGDVHIDLGGVCGLSVYLVLSCDFECSGTVDISSLGSINGQSSSSERKMGGATVTEEEEKMLAEEGIYLPADMPLTKVKCKVICCVTCILFTWRVCLLGRGEAFEKSEKKDKEQVIGCRE